jgi:hypothetical protein
MLETWFFAVRGLMLRVSPISAFSIPRAIRRSTSSSRGEICSIGTRPTSGSGAAWRKPRSTTSAARDESQVAPGPAIVEVDRLLPHPTRTDATARPTSFHRRHPRLPEQYPPVISITSLQATFNGMASQDPLTGRVFEYESPRIRRHPLLLRAVWIGSPSEVNMQTCLSTAAVAERHSGCEQRRPASVVRRASRRRRRPKARVVRKASSRETARRLDYVAVFAATEPATPLISAPGGIRRECP